MTVRSRLLVPFIAALSALACDDDTKREARTTVSIGAQAELSQLLTSDGWSVQLEAFQASIRELRLGELSVPRSQELDLSSGELLPVAVGQLESGNHGGATFTVERMQLAGSASKGGLTKRFDWALEDPLHYVDCGKPVAVASDGDLSLTIELSPATLFQDGFGGGAQLLFQPIAEADSNEDGEVDGDELWEAGVSAYQTDVRQSVASLWELLEALSEQSVQVDGTACRVSQD